MEKLKARRGHINYIEVTIKGGGDKEIMVQLVQKKLKLPDGQARKERVAQLIWKKLNKEQKQKKRHKNQKKREENKRKPVRFPGIIVT